MSDFEGAKKLHFENEIVSPEELYRLRRENGNLQLVRDKLVEKLDRKRKKLEDERANTAVFRQFFQEQKNKVEILERDKETLQVINPSRFDQGQNTEIETLKSEISSMNARLVHLEIAFKEIDRFQKLVPELKLELSGMENECNRLGTSTNDRVTLQQLLNDRTTENETLKTKIQDLSTTNEHYLSQLQRKHFTIETTTNKFDTERQQIQEQANQMETNLNEQLITTREEGLDEKCVALKDDKCVLEIQVEVLREQFGELSEEKEQILEQANQMETNLNEQLITVKEELDEKCVALKGDKCVLEIQVEVLREQIGELSEEKEQILEQANQMETNLNEQLITTREEELDEKCVALKGDKRVLETQADVLRDQIGELSEEREKWQRHVNELEATVTSLQVQLPDFEEVQQNETETIKKYEQQITELTNQITILTAVKENAAISQQLVGKLSQDIKVLETNNKQTQGQFQMELTESKRYREDLERKLGEMARELTDRDRKIQEITQPTAIQQGMGQVSKSPSTPILGSNPKHSKEKDKSQSITPQLVPQPNKTSKSPSKITFRGTTIHVVKLKAFPNMTECHSKQVICTINKHYELGQLMCIAELATKVGFKNAVAKHAGIKLYSPVGNCDGAYKDMRYFDCPPNYGMFVPLEDVYVHVP